METRVLINKQMVKKNKELTKCQKQVRKSNKKVKGSLLKASLNKLAYLPSSDSYLDLTDNTGNDDTHKLVSMPEDLNALLDRLQEKKVCGMSGSGFSTAEKLNTLIATRAPYKFFVINAVACDPGLLQDEWLIRNRLAEIEKGITLLRRYLTFEQIILATKIEQKREDQSVPYSIVRVPDRYPMGEERILIHQVLGRSIPYTKTPAEQGVLVLNVQTVYDIYRAVYRDQENQDKLITVHDLNSGEAVLVRAPYGMLIADIIEKVWSEFRKKDAEYVASNPVYDGSGIMSAALSARDAKVTDKTNYIGIGKVADYPENIRCKGCGACVKNCPFHVNIAKIVKAMRKGKFSKDGVDHYHATDCISCGCCTYFCSAGNNTMDLVRRYKERMSV